jgi:hypothetical protein
VVAAALEVTTGIVVELVAALVVMLKAFLMLFRVK